MKAHIIIVMIVLAVFLPFTVYSENSNNFAVGFKGGTYEHFAISINELPSLSFKITNTQGSNEIIKYVNGGKSDFGIAQLDILCNLDNRESKATENVKLVLPLYSEEVHVLAKKDIKSIYDLSRKTVSVGARNSGSSETALIILSALELLEGKKAVKRLRFMDVEKGLKKLQSGAVDALFVVSGVPVKLLKDLPGSVFEKCHLVPITKAQFRKITKNQNHYRKSEIRPRDYSWLKNSVNTVSVVSSIIVNKGMPDKDVANLVKQVLSNKKNLENRHKKWKEVSKDNIKFYLEGRPYHFHKAAKNTLNDMGYRGESLLMAE